MKKSAIATIKIIAILTCLLIISCSKNPNNSSSQSTASRINLTISAAASLKDVMTEIQPIYEQQKTNVSLTLNLASSGSLRQQIEQGAPVDLFISASPSHINMLQKKGLIIDESLRDLLKNQMVLIVPQQNTASVNTFQDLTKDAISKISIGEPKSVPAGKYAQEVLSSLGIYEAVKPKIVFAKNVRQVVNYVATGNVDGGIVYRTDTNVSNKVKIVANAPEKSHTPVVYPIAIIKDSKNIEAAKQLEEFMFTPEAKAVFEKYGFITLKEGVGSRE
ncbi:MAG: molybdate ABC transporter substrate-binding protein [Okeania sp. SIO3I5]|uniref:molybdate ABC transporter substrate-binding protein n=1 Tax=Okeania sp. SIO3I5 TaxID=2607805 RepID=UPI0013B7556C|nr:molybdate ABC transporter substrate-binding protein [Okeania sp. SIO3I5]NEQ39992.1 molybdate ABC transporter substrate-binding protein [Okeania sp. SIO3I5]